MVQKTGDELATSVGLSPHLQIDGETLRPLIDFFRYLISFPERVTNTLFGHDFFIAYSRSDGKEYAESLDAALSEAFSVHFDARDYQVGNDLSLLSRVRVRNSRHLVVVATPDALTNSTWVKVENDHFVAAKKVPFIVDVDGAVDDALLDPQSDKLSGWIASTRTLQDDGSYIDPVLRLRDDSGYTVNGFRAADQNVISQLKASYTGARVARRRLKIVSSVAVMLLGLLLATTWLANAAYQQLVATVISRSEVSAVAAISLTEQRSMPEALTLAKNALPHQGRWIQAFDPLSVSAAVAVFNGLAIGSSEQMAFHVKDADIDPSAQVLVTVEGDFTEGNPRTMPHWGRLWSVSTGALINEVRLPKNSSFAVEIIAKHRAALYGGFGRELLLWRFGAEETVPFETNEPLAQITEIVSHDDLDIFAVATVNAVHVFDFETGQSVGHAFTDFDTGHTGKPDHSLDLHPNGAWMAAQNAPGVAIFDFVENSTLCDVSQDGHNFVSMRFSPDGRELGLMSGDGTVFAVDVSEAGECSNLRSFDTAAAEGEFLCGRFPAEEATTAFVDRKTWILRLTRERYHADDIYCAYLYDWKEEKTLSTVLLGRGYAPFAQAFLNVDEPHTAHRDLSSLERLGITIVSKELDLFSYRRTLPGGVFIRKRWLRLDPSGITLSQDLSQDAMTFTQPVADDPSYSSWDCKAYDAGPQVATVAVSQSGRFAIVAEPNAIRMHDRETCTKVGVWPISMVRTAEFVNDDAALLVTTAQRQVFRLPMPTSLVEESLAERLSDVLGQIE